MHLRLRWPDSMTSGVPVPLWYLRFGGRVTETLVLGAGTLPLLPYVTV